MIKLVIFDFDGTLADTRELIVKTNQEAQKRMNYPVRDEKTIVSTIGLPLGEGILAMYPDLPLEDIPAWKSMYRGVFDILKKTIIPALFPGVRETLAALYDSGLTLTVASSRGTPSLVEFLEDMGIAKYFSYVLGADDVSKAKPDPEPVLKTLQDLLVRPEEALVVGDMPVDIMMGSGAKAYTCGVTFGNSNRDALKASGADFVIDNFAELTDICRSCGQHIRKAEPRDLDAVNRLLGQVLKVHNAGRPDLFRPVGKKYTDDEILKIFDNPETPVFVYEDGGEVLGYAFCAFVHQNSGSLQALTTLYIDDICIEEKARGRHIGTALFEYAKAFARENGCYNITLHVWECNPAAKAFYESLGMKPQYTSMELILG